MYSFELKSGTRFLLCASLVRSKHLCELAAFELLAGWYVFLRSASVSQSSSGLRCRLDLLLWHNEQWAELWLNFHLVSWIIKNRFGWCRVSETLFPVRIIHKWDFITNCEFMQADESWISLVAPLRKLDRNWDKKKFSPESLYGVMTGALAPSSISSSKLETLVRHSRPQQTVDVFQLFKGLAALFTSGYFSYLMFQSAVCLSTGPFQTPHN